MNIGVWRKYPFTHSIHKFLTWQHLTVFWFFFKGCSRRKFELLDMLTRSSSCCHWFVGEFKWLWDEVCWVVRLTRWCEDCLGARQCPVCLVFVQEHPSISVGKLKNLCAKVNFLDIKDDSNQKLQWNNLKLPVYWPNLNRFPSSVKST